MSAGILVTLGLVSVATFVLTLILVPIVVIKIPENYFSEQYQNNHSLAKYHPALRCALVVLKNILGLVLIVMGILMLVLPGQGLLTIFFGILLVDFPGKFKTQRRLVSYPKVLNSINWIRKKANQNPLIID